MKYYIILCINGFTIGCLIAKYQILLEDSKRERQYIIESIYNGKSLKADTVYSNNPNGCYFKINVINK